MAWEKLGSASVGGSSDPVNNSWKELDRVTLTSSGDTLDTGTFTAKDNIMILENKIPTGSCRSKYQFNADTGNNYAQRYSDNGGTDGTFTSDSVIYAYHSGGSARSFSVHSIINNSSQEKLLIGDIVENGGDGSGNAPNRQELVGKWANTSAQINRVKLFNDGSGSFDTGSELVVLGCDNDEADSGSNFWQELGTDELSSTGDTMNVSFTAKKYIMVITATQPSGSEQYSSFRFNSDTGNNYAHRYSSNGGSDGTATGQSAMLNYAPTNDTPRFMVSYIMNIANKEKLVITESMAANSAGAGNVPERREIVGKWANTSNQITNIQNINLNPLGDMAAGSYMKVYGAD